MLSLKQVQLLHNNAPNIPLSNYISRETFFISFLTHLKELFEEKGHIFYIKEPLNEYEEGLTESTTLIVGAKELGQLFFLVDEFYDDILFFFYSKEFNHKFLLLENDFISETNIKNYYFWLNSLYAFHVTYEDERNNITN